MRRQLAHALSTLTHTDEAGRARMVDVASKAITARTAAASGRVVLPPEAFELVQRNALQKGDVLTVAQLAGIGGAKLTSQLIPLCHNIALDNVRLTVELSPESSSIRIAAEARCTGRTGVEMEALTAVSVAALTVFDMVKAVTHDAVIEGIQLDRKEGGARGRWARE